MRDIRLAIIPATIQTLAVLVGILLNQNGINRFDARIPSLEARFHEDMLMLGGRDTDKSERLARLERENEELAFGLTFRVCDI